MSVSNTTKRFSLGDLVGFRYISSKLILWRVPVAGKKILEKIIIGLSLLLFYFKRSTTCWN